MGFFFTIHIQLSDQLANIHVISPEQQNLKEYLSLPTERWYNSMLAFACEAHTEVTLSPPGVAATLPLSFRDVFPSQRRIFTADAPPLLHRAVAVGFDVTRIVCDPPQWDKHLWKLSPSMRCCCKIARRLTWYSSFIEGFFFLPHAVTQTQARFQVNLI